jgi:hypothetical protein
MREKNERKAADLLHQKLHSLPDSWIKKGAFKRPSKLPGIEWTFDGCVFQPQADRFLHHFTFPAKLLMKIHSNNNDGSRVDEVAKTDKTCMACCAQHHHHPLVPFVGIIFSISLFSADCMLPVLCNVLMPFAYLLFDQMMLQTRDRCMRGRRG